MQKLTTHRRLGGGSYITRFDLKLADSHHSNMGIVSNREQTRARGLALKQTERTDDREKKSADAKWNAMTIVLSALRCRHTALQATRRSVGARSPVAGDRAHDPEMLTKIRQGDAGRGGGDDATSMSVRGDSQAGACARRSGGATIRESKGEGGGGAASRGVRQGEREMTKMPTTSREIRTPNLLIRSQAPCPLGHGGR